MLNQLAKSMLLRLTIGSGALPHLVLCYCVLMIDARALCLVFVVLLYIIFHFILLLFRLRQENDLLYVKLALLTLIHQPVVLHVLEF